MIGRTLGRYHIVALLGRGGMGSVWKADDRVLGRAVALKFLPESLAASSRARRRFLREAREASKLNHPGIATVFDAGEIEGLLCIASALVEGQTLSEISARTTLPPREAARIVADAALALAHAHRRGVIHRDVTGRNIMLTRDGRVVVVDFGLARSAEASRLTATGSTLGTVAYIAPEVAGGQAADARADLYGLGVVFYELLTGTLPFVGERPEAVLYLAVHQPPQPPSARRRELSEAFDRMALKLLAKDPAERHQSAEELAGELRTLARETSESGPAIETHEAREPVPPRDRSGASGGGSPAGGESLPAIPEIRCLAVLPFRDLSARAGDGPGGQMLALGFAETVSASLSRLPGVQVIPPSAAAQAGAADEDPHRVARQLGANLVLSGSLRRSGEQLRVTYSLVHAERGVQLGGDTVNGAASDLFAVEDRLVASVVRALELETMKTPGRSVAPAPHDPAAHEHYLQALGYLQRYDNEASVDGAIALLERLASESSDSAPIEACFGRACLYKYKLTSEREWERRGAAACRRALELDPQSPEVLTTLGELHNVTGRYAQAASNYQESLRLRPENVDALLGLASALGALGQLDAAEDACRRAIELRPNHWSSWSRLGVLYFSRGQYQRAVEPWRKVVELTPDNSRGYYNLGSALFLLGRHDEAIEAYHRSLEIQPNPTAYTNLGTVHFFLGRYHEAAAMFEKAAALRPSDPLFWGNLADAYRWTPGSQSRAAEAFDRAIALMRERLEVNPSDAGDWALLASHLAKRAHAREAVQAIERALELAPHDVNCTGLAVTVYHLVGQRARALECAREALARGYSVDHLKRDPELATLRQDAAFQRLLTDAPSNATGIGS